jgi:hypothetical protein
VTFRDNCPELCAPCLFCCNPLPPGPRRSLDRFRDPKRVFQAIFSAGQANMPENVQTGRTHNGYSHLATGAGLLRTSALARSLGTGAALAQQTDITIGMVLEPPNLDPTAAPRPPSTRWSTPMSSRA